VFLFLLLNWWVWDYLVPFLGIILDDNNMAMVEGILDFYAPLGKREHNLIFFFSIYLFQSGQHLQS